MATPALGLSEKQQALRATGIGASEVWDVLNGGIVTYARKIGEAEAFEGSSLTEFGHRIERVIAEAWTERHPGLRVYTPGTLRHPQHEWALASPDRVVAPLGEGRPARDAWLQVLEIKTVFFSSSEYGEGADEIPERHLVQVAWQQEVCNIEEATLVALVNGDYREYPLHRDRELGALLLQEVGRFWRENVLARVPPPVDGSEAYSNYLKRRHPREAGPMLPATDEAREIVARLRETKIALAQAETLEAEAANQLRALIGDAAGIDGLCSWKQNASGGTDWRGLAESLNPTPEQLAAFARPGARVLRLQTQKKGAK